MADSKVVFLNLRVSREERTVVRAVPESQNTENISNLAVNLKKASLKSLKEIKI